MLILMGVVINKHLELVHQMNKRYLILPMMATVIIMVNTIVSADNRITFPPANIDHGYKYPPQAPSAPRLNHYPSRPTSYVFGQNNSRVRQKMIPTPMQIQRNSGVPVVPSVSPIKNLPPFVPHNFGGNGNNITGNIFPFYNVNVLPFGNGSNGFNPFSKGNMPFSNNSGGMVPSNPMNTIFGNNNQNFNVPFFNSNKKRKKAWGDKRNIWPDFYTDFTDEAWDTMMGGPRKLGRMPGGWRFPYISTPDPVTVSDAIVNQFPPIVEEAGNMADISDWGVFNKK